MVAEDISEVLGKGGWTSCSQRGWPFRASEVHGIHSYVCDLRRLMESDFSIDQDSPRVSGGGAWFSKTTRATLFFSQFLNLL